MTNGDIQDNEPIEIPTNYRGRSVSRRDLGLSEALKAYRKQARMPQWVLAEILGVTQRVIGDIEAVQYVHPDLKDRVREYLRTAPRARKVRSLTERRELSNVYLTSKLLLWAKITDMPSEGVEAVRALKEAYDRAKREEGLAHIPMIQLEVENALTLATRGAYYRERRKTS